jgi:hypothetical protein
MNKFYPIQLWLFIGPILYVFYVILHSGQGKDLEMFALYPIFLIMGLVYSIPLFLIFYITFRLFVQKIPSTLAIKVFLNILLVIEVFITFKIISGSEALSLSISYSIAVIISSIFLRLGRDQILV